ncbi:MAG: RagB/SusD family nutrient uptake outer membrane protein [Flavobacteriaceae bacterium]
MKTLFKHSFLVLIVTYIGVVMGCSTEDLEPTLAQQKSVEKSITDVSNLYGILKGTLNRLTASGYWGREVIATNEVRSDNVFSNGNSGRYTTQGAFNYNENSGGIWDNCYSVVAMANIIINTDISTLTGDQDYGKHLQGSAYFLRALAHYDLVRFYGQQHAGGSLGVPIVTTFKGEEEELFPSRNSVVEVRDAIISDLQTAFSMMSTAFDDQHLVSKMAAPALLSRVAIYFGDWSTAKSAAETVLNSNIYTVMDAATYVSSWAQKKNPNSIFELAFGSTDNRGSNALSYIYRTQANGSGYGDLQVMPEVEALYEDNDVRKGILGYQGNLLRNMRKYPDINGWDNIVLIRIEEIILNYAEALLETGDSAGALQQLNRIANSRNATAYTTANKDNILLERRKELIFEGHRWDDLMRTQSTIKAYGTLMELLDTYAYPNNVFAYPIPADEINANSNIEQNQGY